MNINFGKLHSIADMGLNTVHSANTALFKNLITPDNIKNKSLNMDKIEFSTKIAAELNRMVDENRPVSKEDEIMTENEASTPNSTFRATGKLAGKLYVARSGIEKVMDNIMLIRGFVERLNEKDNAFTENDRKEIQKEIDSLKNKINKISETVTKELGPDFDMGCRTLGVENLSVITKDLAYEALDTLTLAMRKAKDIEMMINKKIEELEKSQYKNRKNNVSADMSDLERQRQIAEKIQNALNANTDINNINMSLNELIQTSATDQTADGKNTDASKSLIDSMFDKDAAQKPEEEQ
ncbi:MAG: hypothetical protein LBH05_05345 [Deferribacteraceae bacterium]|jgi:hypothetical protein|nr:hypothetical protein [Deferribacteraceae bacterium]